MNNEVENSDEFQGGHVIRINSQKDWDALPKVFSTPTTLIVSSDCTLEIDYVPTNARIIFNPKY